LKSIRPSGNPYNDIGASLLGRCELDTAIPWLRKGKERTRHKAPEFPSVQSGPRCEEALVVQPDYEPAA
jgi:hypothetical protein